jgi:hypothetical protein
MSTEYTDAEIAAKEQELQEMVDKLDEQMKAPMLVGVDWNTDYSPMTWADVLNAQSEAIANVNKIVDDLLDPRTSKHITPYILSMIIDIKCHLNEFREEES